MTRQPETVFKERIRPFLESIPNCFVIKIQQVAVRGDPDFVLCICGLFIAMELKKDAKQKPTVLQLHKLKKAELAGGFAIVVCPETWSEAYAFLHKLADKYTADHGLEIPECLRLPTPRFAI